MEPVVAVPRCRARRSRPRSRRSTPLRLVTLPAWCRRIRPVGEHLGVDAVVAAAGRRRGSSTTVLGMPPMPVCSVHAVADVGARICSAMACSTSVGGTSGSVGSGRVALDDHVDLVDRQRVRVVGLEAERAREPRVHLDDEQAVRIGAGAVQFVDASRRRAATATCGRRVGRRDRRGHHARRQLAHRGREAAEVGRHELHVDARSRSMRSTGPKKPDSRRTPGLEEHHVRREQQRAEQRQVFPVVALAEGLEQARRAGRGRAGRRACRACAAARRLRRGSSSSTRRARSSLVSTSGAFGVPVALPGAWSEGHPRPERPPEERPGLSRGRLGPPALHQRWSFSKFGGTR